MQGRLRGSTAALPCRHIMDRLPLPLSHEDAHRSGSSQTQPLSSREHCKAPAEPWASPARCRVSVLERPAAGALLLADRHRLGREPLDRHAKLQGRWCHVAKVRAGATQRGGCGTGMGCKPGHEASF